MLFRSISIFSQKILGKKIANNVNRLGEEVECIKTKNCAHEIERVLKERADKHQSVAIICKTMNEVSSLQKSSDVIKKFKVLSEIGTMSKAKKIITTPANAKGVEFDCVIIPFANEINYHNGLDRNLLYIASTRALHKLYFIADKKPSKFLTKA